jgi:hypothetical protein
LSGTVKSTDTGGDTLARIDGYGKCGAKGGCVFLCLRVQTEAVTFFRGMGTQIIPRPSLAIKLTISGVVFSAAQTKSPSFSRS